MVGKNTHMATKTTKKTREQKPLPTPDEMTKEIKDLKNQLSWLITLAINVGQDGKVVIPWGKKNAEFGRQSLKSFLAQVNKKLGEILSNYKKLNSEKGRRKKRQVEEGYVPKPKSFGLTKISESFRRFWAGANLGNVIPGDPNSPRLVDELPLLTKEGITTPALLPSLWATYIEANGLTDKNNKTLIHPDEHMKQDLGQAIRYFVSNPNKKAMDTYNARLKKYEENLKAGKKVGKKPNNPNSFSIDVLPNTFPTSLSKYFVVPRTEEDLTKEKEAVGNDAIITPAELAKLQDPGTKEEVKRELEIVKEVRDRYKASKGGKGYEEYDEGEEVAE